MELDSIEGDTPVFVDELKIQQLVKSETPAVKRGDKKLSEITMQ
jgi:hypothetical protein